MREGKTRLVNGDGAVVYTRLVEVPGFAVSRIQCEE